MHFEGWLRDAIECHRLDIDGDLVMKMDPRTSKAWNDWAESIARKHAHKIGAEVLALSDKGFKVLCDRIDQLEAEVGRLKGQQPDREEWPLRSIEGGRRA